MFERQLGLRENPFLAGHHPRFVYPSQEHQRALAQLRAGIEQRAAFILITGEAGTGKTVAVFDALAEYDSQAVVALVAKPPATGSLVDEIALRLCVAAPELNGDEQAPPRLEQVLAAVRARGQWAVLVLDDAQNLDDALLREAASLADLEAEGQPLLQVILVGRPPLEVRLAQPELHPLRQRIRVHHRTQSLSATETAHYVHHRVAVAGGNSHELFPTDTCIEMFELTDGVPRDINTVAAQALVFAFEGSSRTVTPDHIRAVEEALLQESEAGGAAVAAPMAFEAPVVSGASTAAPEFAMPPAPAPPEPTSALRLQQLAAEIASIASPPPAVRREIRPMAVSASASASAAAPAAASAAAADPAAASTPAAVPASVSLPAPTAPVSPPMAPAVDDGPSRTDETGSTERLLPAWFDEVVARQRKIDQQETVAASVQQAPIPPSVPAAQPPPGAGPVSQSPRAPGIPPLEPPPYMPSALDPAQAAAPVETAYSIPPLIPGARLADVESPATMLTPPEAGAGRIGGTESVWQEVVFERGSDPGPAQHSVEATSADAPGTSFAPLVPDGTQPERAGQELFQTRVESAGWAARPANEAMDPAPAVEPARVAEPAMEPLELLTARLRAKAQENTKRSPSKLAGFGWIEAIILLVAVAAGVVFLTRFAHRAPSPKEPPAVVSTSPSQEASPTTPAVEVETPPSVPNVGSAESASAPARPPAAPDAKADIAPPARPAPGRSAPPPARALAKLATPPAPVPSVTKPSVRPPREVAPSPAPPAPTMKAHAADAFGIAVGTYADENEANGARNAVSEGTRLPSRVIAVNEGGATAYRVVVGSFQTRVSAERAASDLIRNGLVDEARVMTVAREATPDQ